MAYSPSPQPTPFIASENVLHFGRHSATPPLSQPLSKRDKRRNATMERLNDINATFALNREAHSRAQLNSLTRDINYISRADLYQPKLLDDTADEIYAAAEASIAKTNQLGLRSGTLAGGFGDGEARAGTGKWAAIFTQQVNDAMEERDAQLTALAVCLPSCTKIQDSRYLHVCNYECSSIQFLCPRANRHILRIDTKTPLIHYMKIVAGQSE